MESCFLYLQRELAPAAPQLCAAYACAPQLNTCVFAIPDLARHHALLLLSRRVMVPSRVSRAQPPRPISIAAFQFPVGYVLRLTKSGSLFTARIRPRDHNQTL